MTLAVLPLAFFKLYRSIAVPSSRVPNLVVSPAAQLDPWKSAVPSTLVPIRGFDSLRSPTCIASRNSAPIQSRSEGINVIVFGFTSKRHLIPSGETLDLRKVEPGSKLTPSCRLQSRKIEIVTLWERLRRT